MAREPLGAYRGPLSTAGLEAGRSSGQRADRPAWQMQIDNAGWSWPRDAPVGIIGDLLARGLRGAALDAAIAHEMTRHIAVATMTEQLPSPDNRIVPAFDQRDALGIPRPEISFHYDAYTRAGLADARQLHDRVFSALGVTERHHAGDVTSAGHLIGTCRMGTDPRTSVVEPSCARTTIPTCSSLAVRYLRRGRRRTRRSRPPRWPCAQPEPSSTRSRTHRAWRRAQDHAATREQALCMPGRRDEPAEEPR